MSRTSKIFTSAANALQATHPQPGTFRLWAAETLRAYPARLEADLQAAPKLKNFSNWTQQDKRTAAILAGNFVGFFFLGEMFARGDISGYPVNENPHAHH